MRASVAIPAVVFYNMLSHSVNEVMGEARELRHLILAAGLDAAARPTDAARELEAAETGRRIAQMELDSLPRTNAIANGNGTCTRVNAEQIAN